MKANQLTALKDKVYGLKDQTVSFRVNRGRNKIVTFQGKVVGVYPAMFVIKPTEDVEELNIPFDTFDKDIVNAVGLFLAKAKLEACDKKVVVVVAGLTEVAKAYNYALNGENSTKINEFTSTKVNSLLACAKSIREGNAGITLICLDNYKISEEMQRMFEYDILDNFSN